MTDDEPEGDGADPDCGLVCASLLLVALIVLDLTRKVRLIGPAVLAVYLPLAVNAPLLTYVIVGQLGSAWWVMIIPGLLFCYVWIHLNVFPVMDGVSVGFRLEALGGAPPILLALLYAVIVQTAVLPLSFVFLTGVVPTEWLVANTVYSLGCCLVLYLNGGFRAILASKSLGVLSRVWIASAVWIPVIGWLIGAAATRGVRREYRAAVDRVGWERTLPRDDRCATRYPILRTGRAWSRA